MTRTEELVTLAIDYTNPSGEEPVEIEVTYRPSMVATLVTPTTDSFDLLDKMAEFVTKWSLEEESGAMWPIDGTKLPVPVASRILEAIMNHEERTNGRAWYFRPRARPLPGVRRVLEVEP